MNYKSIKHSFLIILIATTIVGCAGNSVQSPASQYQTSSESFDSRGDTSSIDGDIDLTDKWCHANFFTYIQPKSDEKKCN